MKLNGLTWFSNEPQQRHNSTDSLTSSLYAKSTQSPLSDPFLRLNSNRSRLRPACHSRKRSTSNDRSIQYSSTSSLFKFLHKPAKTSLQFYCGIRATRIPKESKIVPPFKPSKKLYPKLSQMNRNLTKKSLVKIINRRLGHDYDSCESVDSTLAGSEEFTVFSPEDATEQTFQKIQFLIQKLVDEENSLEVSFGNSDARIFI